MNTKKSQIIIDKDFIEKFSGIRSTAVAPEYLEEIGRIVTNFAMLEYELFALIHGLLGTDGEISRIVTSELPFKTLLDLSASLIKMRQGDIVAKTYEDIFKTVTEAEEKRNLIIHSLWGSAPDHVIRSKATAKRKNGFRVQHEKYTKEDLTNVVLLISKAVLTVEIFRKQLGYPDWWQF